MPSHRDSFRSNSDGSVQKPPENADTYGEAATASSYTWKRKTNTAETTNEGRGRRQQMWAQLNKQMEAKSPKNLCLPNVEKQ